MRQYEVVVIFKDNEESFSKGKEFVLEQLKSAEAAVVNENDMGSRELAYEVKKEGRGRYYLFVVDLDPTKIIAIENAFKLKKDILKYLFVVINK